MKFTDNLFKLRKEKGFSQEQLAEMLEVSRQSVYKWESGQSYPELEKLQQICKVFNCSLDELVNGEVKHDTSEKVSKAKIDSEYHKFGLGVAFGMLLGTIGLAGLMFANDIFSAWYIGMIIFFSFGIVSLFLFIYHGIRFDEFEKELRKATSIEFYTSDERKVFMRKFSGLIIFGLGVCVLGILMLIISYGVYHIDGLWPTGVMFILAGIGIFILTYWGIQSDKYDIKVKMNKKSNLLASKIRNVIMLVATIIYLLLGFIWNLWHPGWVVFVVGGISCGIVNVLLENNKSN